MKASFSIKIIKKARWIYNEYTKKRTNEHCSFALFVRFDYYKDVIYEKVKIKMVFQSSVSLGSPDLQEEQAQNTELKTQGLQEKVTAICNVLSAKGQKVSVRVVLSLLPEVKSTSTVHKYFKAWKDTQEEKERSDIKNIGFSEEFARVFLNEINRHAAKTERIFREIALDAKEQSIRAIEDVERAETRLIKQTGLLELRDKEVKELQAEIPLIKNAQNTLVIELKNQIESLNKQRLEHTNSKARLSSDLVKSEIIIENNKEMIATQKAQNQALSEEVRALNSALLKTSKEITRLNTIQESNQTLVTELRESKAALTAQHKALISESRTVNQERHNLQSALTSAQRALNGLKNSEQIHHERVRILTDENNQLKITIIQQNNILKRNQS